MSPLPPCDPFLQYKRVPDNYLGWRKESLHTQSVMKKRPLTVLIVACLFIAAGAIGLVHHLNDFKITKPVESEIVWSSFVGLLAIVSGFFMLLGRNWARWLALAWMAFHLAISFFHSIQQVVIHGLLFLLIAYGLYRPEVRAYFSPREAAPHS